MIKSIKTHYTPSLPSIPKRYKSYKANRDKVFDVILLPFVQAPTCMKDLEKIPFCNRSVPWIDDYGLAYRIGQEYAAHFVQCLKGNPSAALNSVLAGAKKIDVFKELDKRLVEEVRNCAGDDEEI